MTSDRAYRIQSAQKPTRPLSSAGVIADHAARATRNPDAFVTTLLRSRTVRGRDVLAHLATGGRWTCAQLRDHAGAGSLADLGDDLDPQWAGRLATVIALQGPTDTRQEGVALFSALIAQVGAAALRARDAAVFLQLLSRVRARDRLSGLIEQVTVEPGTISALEADLLNPFLYPLLGDERRWLTALARALGLDATLSMRPGSSAFDRLSAEPAQSVTGSAKVTVITSAFNPDRALVNAARSLIAQSWQNWEMLIVDDASTSPTAARFLDEAAALDPRIRVIRKAVNGGTYRARNTALMLARGDFVTCLDSDDWAHPDRILNGIQPMLENPGILATRSAGARVSEDLELTRPGYRTLFPAASSLMFRLSPVVERIGFFDPVRKGADTEYARRIEAAFGRRVVDIGGGALTVLRGLDDTLSAGEFSFGWRHPVRWTYKQSYGVRHRRIAAGEVAAFWEPERPQPSFGTSRWFRPVDPEHQEHRHFDVVLAGDWRRYGGPQISMLQEIEALLDAGLSVGVMHLEALRFFTGRDESLCAPVLELLDAGRIDYVHLDDEAEIDLLMLRYPPILQFPPATPARVQVRRLVIVANQAPAEKDGADQRYVPMDVHRNATELFRREPSWVPQSPGIRAMLTPLLPDDALAGWDDPAIIDVDAWRVERRREPGSAPVVGRFSRDDVIKFPATGDELLRAYDFGPGIEVRMLGATTQVKRLLAESGRPRVDLPATWQVLPHKALDVREFLSGVDVVVYMDHPGANEAFGRALLESAASGALVVASPKHEVTFGDALLYAEPVDVVPLVKRYLADAQLFRSQLARTEERVRQRWGRDGFIRKVRTELAAIRTRTTVTPPVRMLAGEVTLTYGGPASGAPAVTSAGSLHARSAPVRRFADAESCDYLTVIHSTAVDLTIVDAGLRAIVRQYRPGDEPTEPAPFPDGILGVAWRQSGRLWTFATGGLRIQLEDTTAAARVRATAPAADYGR